MRKKQGKPKEWQVGDLLCSYSPYFRNWGIILITERFLLLTGKTKYKFYNLTKNIYSRSVWLLPSTYWEKINEK